MTAALIGTAGIVVAAFAGWVAWPDRTITLFWLACASAVAFLVLAILYVVRHGRAGTKARAQRRADQTREARDLAHRFAEIAADVQVLVLGAREAGPSSDSPIRSDFTEIGCRVKQIYEEAYSKGYRSDGVERELGGLRSIDELERLGTALYRLSQEIANRF